mmetsp:Transcript_5512/g.34097  ORF Transcript_5512/g.34097 Transcript_5512/m.34097 type:complete len:218 (-) Transcript_5512:2567-3220(-)
MCQRAECAVIRVCHQVPAFVACLHGWSELGTKGSTFAHPIQRSERSCHGMNGSLALSRMAVPSTRPSRCAACADTSSAAVGQRKLHPSSGSSDLRGCIQSLPRRIGPAAISWTSVCVHILAGRIARYRWDSPPGQLPLPLPPLQRRCRRLLPLVPPLLLPLPPFLPVVAPAWTGQSLRLGMDWVPHHLLHPQCWDRSAAVQILRGLEGGCGRRRKDC